MSPAEERALQSPALSCAQGTSARSAAGIFSVVSDYVSLTKPGVMVLLLISTCCPMVLAANGRVDLHSLIFVLLGGALVSGSAAAMNCIWDRDIDLIMERTKKRPIPDQRISVVGSFIFATALAIAGLALLAWAFNPFTAGIALFGHLFYVLIYTMWLKRSTPQNIVIGGAAGAVPPLVGWVAVTGNLNATALYLFLFIFLWTPPHFWALALNKNEDYRRANVPMLPVLAGDRATVRQMLYYSLTLLPMTILLILSDSNLGQFSIIVLVTLSILFTYRILLLKRDIDSDGAQKTKLAWNVFGFSMVYLALFFVCLVVDSALI